MIDLQRLRAEPSYRAGIERKRVARELVDEVLDVDTTRRELLTRVEELRAAQNAASKEIGRAAVEERPAKIAAATALKEELALLEPELSALDERLRALALQVPNPADVSVPDGGEDDGEVLRVVGDTPGAPPLDHAAFGEAMGWVNSDKAVDMSGSRFAYVMREAVLVELALLQWVMRILVREGFAPVAPPVLVREHAMEEAGFFPTDRSQVYEVDGGELFLVGTSEVPLSALHRGEILESASLPLRYAGMSSNFRREAGTYGTDTRGIFRMHQFDKVEMFSFSHPDESWDEHQRILAIEEEIYGGLGLPYRVVNIAAGDLGPAAAKKYDIEAWLPSEGRYRELTSCSNYLDYSARRLGTRLREDSGTRLVHTLNGTACAISRTLLFLFEHYQQPDGSFAVPEVLQPFLGGLEVVPRPAEYDAAMRTPGRSTIAALVVVGLSALILTACLPPGGHGWRTYSYSVATDGAVESNVDSFREMASKVFNDDRSWHQAGINFVEVPEGGDFTLVLAAPGEVPKYDPVCDEVYSCTVGRNVVINDIRWAIGSWNWPGPLDEYRTMVLNHELGHWLGLGHAFCAGPGELAPVMQQQSINMQGCAINPWPQGWELDRVR